MQRSARSSRLRFTRNPWRESSARLSPGPRRLADPSRFVRCRPSLELHRSQTAAVKRLAPARAMGRWDRAKASGSLQRSSHSPCSVGSGRPGPRPARRSRQWQRQAWNSIQLPRRVPLDRRQGVRPCFTIAPRPCELRRPIASRGRSESQLGDGMTPLDHGARVGRPSLLPRAGAPRRTTRPLRGSRAYSASFQVGPSGLLASGTRLGICARAQGVKLRRPVAMLRFPLLPTRTGPPGRCTKDRV